MQEGGDVKDRLCGKKPAILPYGLKPPERASTLMRVRRTAGLDNPDADGAAKWAPLNLQETPILWTVSPLGGKTTDRRAGCGRSARPVQREGASKSIDAPYPYRQAMLEDLQSLQTSSPPCSARPAAHESLSYISAPSWIFFTRS